MNPNRHRFVLAITLAGCSLAAHAQESPDAANAPVYAIGAGVQRLPAWLGARHQRTQPIPFFDIELPGKAELSSVDGLTVDIVRGKHWHGGLYADIVWGRSRDHQQSSTIADLFEVAGLDHDPALLTAYREFWEPHTRTDPEVRPLFERLRADGVRIGVLSNTFWPRAWHVAFFERDRVYDLVDGDVYTSEIPWTKPSPRAFEAAMRAVGATDPSRCVYVGDRLFDDVWGAQQAGMKAVHIPLSAIPLGQVGHAEGTPDGVVHALSELPAVIAAL